MVSPRACASTLRLFARFPLGLGRGPQPCYRRGCGFAPACRFPSELPFSPRACARAPCVSQPCSRRGCDFPRLFARFPLLVAGFPSRLREGRTSSGGSASRTGFPLALARGPLRLFARFPLGLGRRPQPCAAVVAISPVYSRGFHSWLPVSPRACARARTMPARGAHEGFTPLPLFFASPIPLPINHFHVRPHQNPPRAAPPHPILPPGGDPAP